MQAAGVDVRVYGGDQISRRGDGGPTCLTRPLERLRQLSEAEGTPIFGGPRTQGAQRPEVGAGGGYSL